MNLLQRFIDHIQQHGLFSAKDKLLLAVSGGLDSVALCELCRQAGYDFEIAHCNFKLRDKESERDRKFVEGLAKKYGVRFYVKDFETEQYAADNKLSIQEAARELRYKWFEEIINEQLAAAIKEKPNDNSSSAIRLLTAHHADDNIETLMMHFFRGTGLNGLAGIPEKSGYIRRPLLPFFKDELLAFANENKLEYVVDSSNQSSKYTRNYFRNELIPALQKIFPQVKENLQDNISRFKEISALYKLSVSGIKKKLVREKGNERHIPVKQLLGYKNRALIYEIIAEFGFTEKQIDEVIKLSSAGSGHYIDSPGGSYRIIRHRHWFIISPAAAEQSENIIIEETAGNVLTTIGNLQLSRLPFAECRLSASGRIACLDLREISFPLLLRRWKTGDYFYPLGMKKKKKISRFLIDLKLSRPDKEKVWVIESNKRIIWVAGYRIDDRFKLTEKTKTVLKIQLD